MTPGKPWLFVQWTPQQRRKQAVILDVTALPIEEPDICA